VLAVTIEKLREFMDLSWASASEETKTTIAKSNEARKVVNFPYTSSLEEPLFIAMGTEGESPIGTTTAPRGVSNVPIVECPIGGCGQSWKASLMRHHMGCHLIHQRPAGPSAVDLAVRHVRWRERSVFIGCRSTGGLCHMAQEQTAEDEVQTRGKR
jgi:hypothetical protein